MQVKLLSPALFLNLPTPVLMREWKPLAISIELALLLEKKEASRASTGEADWDVHSAARWNRLTEMWTSREWMTAVAVVIGERILCFPVMHVS